MKDTEGIIILFLRLQRLVNCAFKIGVASKIVQCKEEDFGNIQLGRVLLNSIGVVVRKIFTVLWSF